jgi:hypothetical protein
MRSSTPSQAGSSRPRRRIAVNVAERDGLAGVDDDGNGYADD